MTYPRTYYPRIDDCNLDRVCIVDVVGPHGSRIDRQRILGREVAAVVTRLENRFPSATITVAEPESKEHE